MRDDVRVRVLLIAAVVVTAIGTHWIDRGGPMLRSSLGEAMPSGGGEVARTVDWLNDFYASPDGLQRPHGLCAGDRLDSVGIGTWVFDSYVRARLDGATEDEARSLVKRAIEQTDEWRRKHPSATP